MGIGLRLKDALERKGMTCKELADRLGVAPSTIYSMIARDSKKASVDLLIAMASELGTTTDYLLGTADDSAALIEIHSANASRHDQIVLAYYEKLCELHR